MTMELLHAYRFGVTIQNTMMGYQELSGIAREIEVETYQEGGRNDAVLLFPKRTAAQGTITLKKGVYSGQSHPFYLVGEQLDSMKIEVYGHDGRTVMKTYMLKNLLVSKWEVSSLQAQGNEALIDTFTLAYGELHVLS